MQKVTKFHLEGLKEVLDSSALFPSEYLDDMISDYFINPDSEDIWFTYMLNDRPIALGYCVPEKFTNGTFNLYAIAVHGAYQGKGIGKEMMLYIEKLLTQAGKRVLLVETSSQPRYDNTRAFYHKIGYTAQAVLPHFWDEGDDKVIFYKKLLSTRQKLY
ncbi:GNAT family N-acetyltransferase [Flavobacterium aurantiibacter]|uniref:GNAT family N-acetyltransferase n=1 Tax=Flavobacterium aurantiibacter TaxID=2023067 RepID=UPI0013FD57DD|nr:GNAT family N-acetyltransferase [Flavobacterium aurantiibacter]